MWDKECFQISRELYNDRFVVIESKWLFESLNVVMINVYASNSHFEHRTFWGELEELQKQFNHPWILGGDFNAVMNRSERSKYVGVQNNSKAFCRFIDECKLVSSIARVDEI